MERLEPLILTYARWVLTRHRYLITGLRGVGGFHSRPTPTLSGCHQFGPPCQNLTNKTARLREQCRSGAQSTRFFWIPPACFCGGFVSRYNRSQTLHTHTYFFLKHCTNRQRIPEDGKRFRWQSGATGHHEGNEATRITFMMIQVDPVHFGVAPVVGNNKIRDAQTNRNDAPS